MQKGDFIGLFREMKGLPVTIRLLDPPLHEFLPQEEKDIEELCKTMKVPVSALKHKIELAARVQSDAGPPRLPPRHHLSRRSTTCRCAAIMEAACELVKNEGFSIVPEIMIPLIATVKEL